MAETPEATGTSEMKGMGWLRDYPDFRDHTPELDQVPRQLEELGQKDSVKAMLGKVGVEGPAGAVPPTVDLRGWCSPIEDQGRLGSCTAHAGIGLVEYFERRAFGTHIDASRRFLYKTTRDLLHWEGDTGAFLRTTMRAMVLFGVPPEEHWLYTDRKPDFDEEPSAFLYSYAESFRAIDYYRLDPPGTALDELLNRIKTYLAAGLPSMFGFRVYSSYTQAKKGEGKIPYPTPGESAVGGHAVDAVGYDDGMKIKNTNQGARETTGAFLIRNSWGTEWGADGYGWLPYEYVLKRLAVDWWSLLKQRWVDEGNFKL